MIRTLIASLLFLAYVNLAVAEVYNLEMYRIIVIDGGVLSDSKDDQPRAEGYLDIEIDESGLTRVIKLEARLGRENPAIIEDTAISIWYSASGAAYEFFSTRTSETYFLNFIRRAFPEQADDPAIIFLYTKEGVTYYIEYQYPKSDRIF